MNAIAKQVTSTTEGIEILDLDRIHKRENHNPRRLRSSEALADMRESIRTVGVLQPILVRPHPTLSDQYELVAGETRFDLSIDVGRASIPALIREINDDQMVEYATIENVQRHAMSPLDEGRAAQQLIAQGYSNDEVCAVLGWKPPMLQSRIQLTHCIHLVGQALIEKRISIGHAQLLSGLRESAQDKALAVILKRELTVDQFRAELERLSLKLSSAGFDTTDCAACPHNSSTQANLFDAQTGSGRCLNKQCFDEKRTNHLEATRAELTESYNRIALSDTVAKDTTQIIASTGRNGVGQEQISACHTCADFGAVIDTALGNRAKVTENVCFNVACHKEKAQSYQDAIAGSSVNTVANDSSDTSATAYAVAADQPAGHGAAKTKVATGTDKAGKPKRSAIPLKIIEQHHKVHRDAAAHHLATNKDFRAAQIMGILAMLNESHQKPEDLPADMPSHFRGLDRAKAAARLSTLTDQELMQLQITLAAQSLKETGRGDDNNTSDSYGALAEWYSATESADLAAHFKVDQDYLKAFTKPVITELLVEAGFAKAYNAKLDDEKAFDALMNDTKGKILAKVGESGFGFQGFIPKHLKL